MFTKSDTTKAPKSWKNTVLAALAGVACLGVGLQMYETVAPQENLSLDAIQAYTTSLVDHRDYTVELGRKIEDLMQEGVANMHQSYEATVNLVTAAEKVATTMKDKGAPALTDGTKALGDNVKWGKKAGAESVDPKKVQKSFADSAQFNAEISTVFPKSYGIITKLRQTLKIHHFDLSNTIKDVELLATTTKDGLRRSIRKLDLRKKYDGQGKLNANMDVKIWKYEIKTQVADLGRSVEKCNAIIEILKKLQKDCARTQDDIEAELEFMSVELKKRVKAKQIKIKDLEAQMAATKCNILEAIFTLGIACHMKAKQKSKLNVIKMEFAAELKASEKLVNRMSYFDGLVKTAATLTAEATGLLETTKKFGNRLEDTKRELEQDFTDEEIEDNLFDEDFANDFAERLFESFERLSNMCDEAIKDCKERKARLVKALIWGDL